MIRVMSRVPLSVDFERRPLPPRERVVDSLRAALSRRPEVRLGYLFGSLARDGAGALSDVDVGVLVDPGVLERSEGFDYESELIADLMAATGTSKIDLVVLNGAPSLIRHRVVQGGLLLLARDPLDAIRFRVAAVRDCLDFQPMREVQHRYFKAWLGLPPRKGRDVTADRPVVERHLRRLREMATVLRRHRGLKAEDFSRDLETALMIQHAFQLAIQNVIDVGNHLLAARGESVPDTYEAVLLQLGRAGIVPPAFAERIRKMAGFRNVLVHAYVDVDPRKVADALRHVEDFEEFARHAQAELDRAS
jgi:uncharacterized protein YutE (UPF0331/DUF86 family)/predicted nucleotidyltransferase